MSYTIYQAYKKEKRKFVPQVVEIIDDETLRILGENAIESGYFKIESLNNIKIPIRKLLIKRQCRNR
ncbi:hypothetical protein BCJMU39_3183 [Bacillus cereus]|nr:hypothetical protein BCM0045_3178 [Bacillus cereus]BCC01125.1 hypothetical protein BCM0057_3207 [Bacillus cereus]BCC65660.1 hypothetical protein BCJMU39_3183 [Bacillus cereus]BCC94774.1 hypothetical protein BC30043_3203 [Bacillus cereus]BCD18434.1 hypothetical protein BC30077_3210 [Bacillus cereus]